MLTVFETVMTLDALSDMKLLVGDNVCVAAKTVNVDAPDKSLHRA